MVSIKIQVKASQVPIADNERAQPRFVPYKKSPESCGAVYHSVFNIFTMKSILKSSAKLLAGVDRKVAESEKVQDEPDEVLRREIESKINNIKSVVSAIRFDLMRKPPMLKEMDLKLQLGRCDQQLIRILVDYEKRSEISRAIAEARNLVQEVRNTFELDREAAGASTQLGTDSSLSQGFAISPSGYSQSSFSPPETSHLHWMSPGQAQASTGTLYPQGYSDYSGYASQAAQASYTLPHTPSFSQPRYSPHNPTVKVDERIISVSDQRAIFPDYPYPQRQTSHMLPPRSSHSTHSDQRSLRRQSEEYERTALPPYRSYQREIHHVPGEPSTTHLQQPAEYTSPGTAAGPSQYPSAGPSQNPSAGHRRHPSNASSYYASSSQHTSSDQSRGSYHTAASQMSRTPSQYSQWTGASDVSEDPWFKQSGY
ncbi:hypothetical protein Hypma_002171 [Hypsizygus marmoreus]|uniref:Uncharacterized protein n=1 Tax=Hypsizygus marmoreus TaxID=39966 RepID=A0A369K4V8_HYPMA|nr:hypothetical protein Hypma_002171 [Hypsizygus marmoreus]